MSTWKRLLNKVQREVDRLAAKDSSDPFFRGQPDSKWKLNPGAARRSINDEAENRLYYGFTSLGSHLFQPNVSTWDVLFLMQHYGIPTRLLDWTENFAVALYFALKGCKSEGAVWMLDPYGLNLESVNEQSIPYPNSDYPVGYHGYFIDERNPSFGKFPAAVMAIGGTSSDTRMRSQRGVFTLHRELRKPLEELYPNAVTKIVIPKSVIPEAKQFLKLSGINEYSLFPDLDGLARYLVDVELT